MCGTLAHSLEGGRLSAISSFLHTIYGISLKWEPHGTMDVWGKGSNVPLGPKLSLVRKAMYLGLSHGGNVQWVWWLDVTFPPPCWAFVA